MGNLDDTPVPSAREEWNGPNVFAVEVGTNGLQGGDAGHGSRALLRFENVAATAWEVAVDGPTDHPDAVTLWFGGDSEVMSLAESLEFAARELRRLLA